MQQRVVFDDQQLGVTLGAHDVKGVDQFGLVLHAERKNGLKSVGFNLQEGSDYDGMMDLMVSGRSQREVLDSIPFYRENKLVQEALKRVEQYIGEKPLNVEKTRSKGEKGEIQKTKSQKRREDMSL